MPLPYVTSQNAEKISREVAKEVVEQSGGSLPEVSIDDNGKVLGVVEGVWDVTEPSGGTTVVANPTLAGTEEALEGLQVGETKYKVDAGTTVVANPTLAGTEAGLEGLQVGETKYKVDAGTTVVANPTLAGTEADLTGLQVGETKYKIPSGGSGAATHITLMDLIDIDDILEHSPDGITIEIDGNLDADFYTSWCMSFAQAHGFEPNEDTYFELIFYPTCTNYLKDSSGNFGGALLDVIFDKDGNTYISNTIGSILNPDPLLSPVALPGPFYNCMLYRCTNDSEVETGYVKVTEGIPALPFNLNE